MPERIARKTVVFAHPFRLCCVDGLQPAGRYDVETVEEQIEGLSFVAYRRVSTTIEINNATAIAFSRQVTAIDPGDLAEALARDAEAAHAHA
jgi:hypothetical protein